MFTDLISHISSALPSICVVCGGWPRARVCADCTARFTSDVHRCTRCARQLPQSAGDTACGQCLHSPTALAQCHAVLAYAYPWNDLIAKWKFRADVGMTRSLAALALQDAKARALVQGADWVIPMPLFKTRLQARGYNQSALLASAICQGMPSQRQRMPDMDSPSQPWPLVHAPRLSTQLLLRVRDTPEQVGLGRQERVLNMRGAFALEPALAEQVKGRHILLIDDVMTTGATLFAAGAPLLQAHAASVSALVLARAEE